MRDAGDGAGRRRSPIDAGAATSRCVGASLSHPGGNITGFTMGEFPLGGKMLEVLKEISPQVNRVAVLLNEPLIEELAHR